MTSVRAVCVYCGSSSGNDDAYVVAAQAVGRLLAENGITLVYGGGAVGLMNEAANAALAAGGAVIGVLPRGLFSREIAHLGLTQLIEVASLHERKMQMYELSDAFVALPGGLGTLEELTEMLTWSQLGIHHKPIATLDVSGFWAPFHMLLEHMMKSGFMKPENRGLVINVAEIDGLLRAIGAV